MGEKFSPTMQSAIDHALKHSGGKPEDAVLIRFPGGFWSNRERRSHSDWFGTSTIEAIVKRGGGKYIKWQEGKHGKFPIEMQVTL